MKNYIFVSKDNLFVEPHPDCIVYEEQYPHRIVVGFGVGDSPGAAFQDMLHHNAYVIYPGVHDVVCYEVGEGAVEFKTPWNPAKEKKAPGVDPE